MNFGNKIITDGLVLCLDAADLKSYPGSGNIWYDRTSNKNNTTEYGDVPFSTDGGGCFDFSGVTGTFPSNATLGFTFASNMVPTTGNFTFNMWVKNPPTNASQCGLFSNAGGADGYRFGIGKDAIYWLIGPTYAEGNISFSSALNSTSWYSVTAVYARAEATPQIRLYLNGVFQGSNNFPASQTAFTNYTPGLVRSPCCMPIYNGKLSCFTIYNRALSVSEIQQNFNSQRKRFNI